MKENIYRNVYCGNVDKSYVGKEIRLAGWVNSIRNLGGLLFITLTILLLWKQAWDSPAFLTQAHR